MKIILAESDFTSNKITKIARSISKVVNPDLNLPHAKILLITSNILGYQTYYLAKQSSEEYLDANEISRFGSLRLFDDHYAPPVTVLKDRFKKVLSGYVADHINLDNEFPRIPFHALAFFKDNAPEVKLSKRQLDKIRDKYFNYFKETYFEPLKSVDFYEVTSFRRDVFNLIDMMDKKDADYVLSKVSLINLLNSEVTVSVQDGDDLTQETGFFKDLVLRPIHEYMVKRAVASLRLNSKIPGSQFLNISNNLFQSFLDKFGKEKTIEFFKSWRNTSGFFGEYSPVGWGCRWKPLKSPLIPHGSRFVTARIKNSDPSSDCYTSGIYWKYEKLDSNGKAECIVSGGYYTCDDKDWLPSKIGYDTFPKNENDAWSREHDLIERMIELDRTQSNSTTTKRNSRYSIAEQLGFLNICTISTLEKRSEAAIGIGQIAIKEATEILWREYGSMSLFVYAAPMQYIDWKQDDDFDPIKKQKKRDMKKLLPYLKKIIPKGIPAQIVLPDF